MIDKFIILIVVIISRVHIFVKTNQIVYFEYVVYNPSKYVLIKLYFKRSNYKYDFF